MDTFIGYNKIHSPQPSVPKDGKFEILLVKIFSLKQKINQILPATTEKIKMFLFKKSVFGSFNKGLQWESVKQNSFRQIQAHSNIFWHIQTYSGIFQIHSDIFRTLCNPDIFRAFVFSEIWHVQNQKHIQNPVTLGTRAYSELSYIQSTGVFRTQPYSEFQAYSEPYQRSRVEHFSEIVKGYNCFCNFCNINFSRSQLYEINMNFFNAVLIFTTASIYSMQKNMGCKGIRCVNFDIPIC